MKSYADLQFPFCCKEALSEIMKHKEKNKTFARDDIFHLSAKSDGMRVVFFPNDLSGSGLSVHCDNRLEIAAKEEKEHTRRTQLKDRR